MEEEEEEKKVTGILYSKQMGLYKLSLTLHNTKIHTVLMAYKMNPHFCRAYYRQEDLYVHKQVMFKES